MNQIHRSTNYHAYWRIVVGIFETQMSKMVGEILNFQIELQCSRHQYQVRVSKQAEKLIRKPGQKLILIEINLEHCSTNSNIDRRIVYTFEYKQNYFRDFLNF